MKVTNKSFVNVATAFKYLGTEVTNRSTLYSGNPYNQSGQNILSCRLRSKNINTKVYSFSCPLYGCEIWFLILKGTTHTKDVWEHCVEDNNCTEQREREKTWRNTTRNFVSCTVYQILLECNTHAGDERCIQTFSQKTGSEENSILWSR
jgi:hypothetical protein